MSTRVLATAPPMRDALRALFRDPRDKLFVFVFEEALMRAGEPIDPDDVLDETVRLLAELSEVSGRAVTILSDRPLDDVDRLLTPLRLPGCGQGGLEVRIPGGEVLRSRIAADLDPVRRLLAAEPEATRGLIVTDEGLAIALRHDGDPVLEEAARVFARVSVSLAPAVLRARFDAAVTHVVFAGAAKGRALARIMSCDAFIERIPLVFGGRGEDDDVVHTALSFGGTVISVGTPCGLDGEITLPGTNDVRWLIRDFLADLSGRTA